jgi:NAD(P)H-hydrate repair Nnr-like enzyme with NAD(P)H-hydrate epimerase domain
MSQLYPLLTIDEARVFESEVLGEDELQTLEAMVNAGQAIGIAILNDFQEIRDWSEFPQVLVLAGKGLNSGDAFVACSMMREALEDLQVTVVMTQEECNLNKLAAGALEKLRTELGDDLKILDVETYLAQEPVAYDVVIDGLYGHGFRPPLRMEAAELLQPLRWLKEKGHVIEFFDGTLALPVGR